MMNSASPARLFLTVGFVFVAAMPVLAQGERSASAAGDFQARSMLQRAQELLDIDEHDRGVKMLESLLEQYPESVYRYHAYLALGQQYLDRHEQPQAIKYLRHLRNLDRTSDEPLTGDLRDLYLEGSYLTGVAYYQMRQYPNAFPVLREITRKYPNTIWANQAYYYIGMCHFAQENWGKSIKALGLVGTFIDPESPSVEFVEAGRRFYVKIEDTDLKILNRLGKEVSLRVQSESGDSEVIVCIPLAGQEEIFIGSIPTELGKASPNDGKLQVIGGDTIATSYIDNNTREGEKDLPRRADVQVVSTASVSFTRGDYQSSAEAVFLGQPIFLLLQDADLDETDGPETVTVRLVSRFQEERGQREDDSGDLSSFLQDDEVRYETRDEVSLVLTEQGESPIRSGRFTGKLEIVAHREGQPIDKADTTLTCAIGDEVVVSFVDEMHINGSSPREVRDTIVVASEIDGRPQVTTPVVTDPVLRAKKNLVEAEAYLELGRIFHSMGLVDGAKEKSQEGLARVDPIIRDSRTTPIPRELLEQAFKHKWELYLVTGDYRSAIATCRQFNALFPDSPFVDSALMSIANARMEEGEPQEAVGIYQQVLRLPTSQVKPEASFRIAEAYEKQYGPEHDRTIAQYKHCAERYPESPFAGEAVAKLVDYYISTNDFAQADDLLERIFEDYPDAKWLDSMLLKWVIVAYRTGDFAKSLEKCDQLVFEYPSSRFAEKAKEIRPRIEARLNR